MFIYGKYQYKNSIQKLYAFNLQEILQTFHSIQRYIDTKKKGYFVGYCTYESALLLQSFFTQNAFQYALNHDRKIPLVYFELFTKRKKIKKRFFLKKYTRQKNKKALFRKKQGIDSIIYTNDFACIKENIAAGHTYQVNYTQEMQLQPNIPYNPKKYFRILASLQPTKYKAYIFNEFLHILSFSPELFFTIENNQITTQPMKGTIQRGYKHTIQTLDSKTLKNIESTHIDRIQDKKNKTFLQHDKKNRSENVMIVDLLRNDLSRIAKKVEVKELFKIHTYPTLHQMVSTITAQLHKKYRILDIFQALFP